MKSQDIQLEDQQHQEMIKPLMRKQNQNGQIVFCQWEQIIQEQSILNGLKKAGYFYPSQIQYLAIPQIVKNQKDVICQARSGMGKTAIYITSLLIKMKPVNGKYIPHQCIIISSSRQLVEQIHQHFEKVSGGLFKKLKVSPFIGGTNIYEQSKDLRSEDNSVNVIIATLGRLRHLLQIKYIQGFQVQYVVIDQCDKILQNKKGRQDLQFILSQINPKRQIMMFTATLNQQIKPFCLQILKPEPIILQLAQNKQHLPNIDHLYVRVFEKNKIDKLTTILDTIDFAQSVIFVNKIQRAQKLFDILKIKHFHPINIHSKLHQADRSSHYQQFKKGSNNLIVATDVFGRGIDVQKVDVVINYDFPLKIQDFLHRSARAGRFGKKGTTINMLKIPTEECNNKQKDQDLMKAYAKQLGITFKEIPKKGMAQLIDLT